MFDGCPVNDGEIRARGPGPREPTTSSQSTQSRGKYNYTVTHSTNRVPRIGQARIKNFFYTGGVEWGRSELGFCLLRVGGPKHVVKVYYLKLTKKNS